MHAPSNNTHNPHAYEISLPLLDIFTFEIPVLLIKHDTSLCDK